MKKILALLCVLSFVFEGVYGQKASSETPLPFNSLSSKADALLKEVIFFNESMGISAGIYKDGNMVWTNAAGYIDAENKVAANSMMLNRTASIAKPMTAIAILQLYEQNKLDLDDTIQKYLPSFPIKPEGDITIRHLLHHSSGISAYASAQEASPTANYASLSEAVDVFKHRSLRFKPGTDYYYTTYGYVVLGAIVEKASGSSFRNYMKQHIWDVAGMSNTDVEIYGTTYPNKSKLYFKQNDGEIAPDLITNLSVKIPGGGFYTTSEDLLHFGEAILTNTLIKPETLDLMMADPGTKSRGNPYGMGWFLYGNEDHPNGRIIGHSGSQSGTSTQFMIYPDKNVVVAVLGNTYGVWNNIFDVSIKLAHIAIHPESISIPLPKIISLSEDELEQYIGSYQSERGTIRRVRKIEDYLSIGLNNDIAYVLYPTSENAFLIRRGDITIEFVKNEQSGFFDLLIKENGETYLYSKS